MSPHRRDGKYPHFLGLINFWHQRVSNVLLVDGDDCNDFFYMFDLINVKDISIPK